VATACAPSLEQVQGRAALLVERGRYEEAEALLRSVAAEKPNAREPRRLLVRVLGLQGKLGPARDEAERLAEKEPGSAVPWIELGHAFELAHRYDEALRCYDRAARAAPRDPAGPRTGGMRAARWGEVREAEPRLIEALRRDSRDARVWHALGLVRTHLGNIRGARDAYQAGLKADRRALENRLGLATVAWLLDEPAEALSQYDAILSERPGFADAHLGRSWALIRLGRYDEAERALDQGQGLGADATVVARQRDLLYKLRAKGRIGGDVRPRNQ
jgi:tetratricopeptide (TPR) repeat protein